MAASRSIETSSTNNNSISTMAPASRALIRSFRRLLLILSVIHILFIGLIVNSIQFCLFCTQKLSKQPNWRRHHKKLNGLMVYMLAKPVIAFLNMWADVRLKITFDDLELIEDMHKPMIAILLTNHNYELDWLACYSFADQLAAWGSYKGFLKDELKYVPVIGWGLRMADFIYLKRNWQKDKLSLSGKLNELLLYDQTIMQIFAEGTRWSPKKHLAAQEFARRRHLEPFKHHLVPKVRGACYSLRHFVCKAAANCQFRLEQIRLFNVETVVRENPTFQDFLGGKPVSADLYCEEVKLEQDLLDELVRSESEDDCHLAKQLIYDIYRRKDYLVDEYEANGRQFPIGPCGGLFPTKSNRLESTIFWFTTLPITYGSLAYLSFSVFSGSLVVQSMLTAVVVFAWLFLKYVERASETDRNQPSSSELYAQQGKSLDPVASESHCDSVNYPKDKIGSSIKDDVDFYGVKGRNCIAKSTPA